MCKELDIVPLLLKEGPHKSPFGVHLCRRLLTATAVCTAAHIVQTLACSRDSESFPSFYCRFLLLRLLWCYVVLTGISLVTKLGCRIMSMRVCAETLFAKLKVR